MSCFLDILRCILCCEDEERPLTRNNLSYYEYNRIPDYGSWSRTTSPATDSTSRKQFNFEQTTSAGRTIEHKSYSNSSYASTGLSRQSYDNLSSSKLPAAVKPSDGATLSGLNKKNSAAISHYNPYALPASLSLPKTTSISSIGSKPTLSSTSEKLKGKASPLTQSSVKAFQQDATSKKSVLIKGNISDVLELDASQRMLKKSHESYDQKRGDLLPSTKSASLKSSPLNTKPVRLENLEKSSNVSQNLKDSPSIAVPNCTFQTQVTKKVINKTIDGKPPQGESSAKLSILSIKPTLSLAPSSPASNQGNSSYFWVEKGASSTYVCPDDIKSLIEKDIVPGVLKKPLSMPTYKEFFQALLYAEDIYLEKWEGFEMENVTLQLHKAAIYGGKDINPGSGKGVKKVEKTFIAFEVDKIPEKRPYLLSRDFVTVQPLRNKIKTFQGVIYRVIKSNLVLAEFEEGFHRQHDPSGVYNVKFSFNRVCLKRAHQAILAVSDNLLRNFLFPNLPRFHSPEPYGDHRVGRRKECALQQILSLQGSPPYLVEGPLSLKDGLSETGVLVVDIIIKICRTFPSKRILLCAPTNNTCDVFMRALKKKIPESDMFRANAAFREVDGVPDDILPSCLYKEEQECFSCPSLNKLLQFKVILSTFMSSFRLHNEGIVAGHFSHIFLVDASSAIEPEILVPLVHLTNETTAVVVTGAPGNCSRWVRSNIARWNGLKISYFERLRQSRLYQDLNPNVITVLESADQKSDRRYNLLFY